MLTPYRGFFDLYDFDNDRQYSVSATSEEGVSMYIQELIGDKGDVISAAMSHPGLAPKRKPTIENAMKAVATEVENRVRKNVSSDILPKLENMLGAYQMMNGEYDDLPAEDISGDPADTLARDEYGEGLDNEVEKLIQPWEPYLSADWLGKNTIDTRLWEPGAVAKLADSIGKEVYKQLSYQKTPAQVLSNAAIVQADVEIYFDQHLNAPEPENKAVTDENSMQALALTIKQHVGETFDLVAVYDDLEMAMDDDEILAGAAAQRLGMSEDDLNTLQMLSLEHGDGTVDALFEHVKDAKVGKAAAKAEKAAAKADKAAAKAEKPAPVAKDAMDPRILTLIKDHSGVKDTDLASKLGVSRATYNNWLTGKSPFKADAEQYQTLRDQIVADANGLLEALSLLDGTEQFAVS